MPERGKTIVNVTTTCSGNVARCSEFLEILMTTLRTYISDPPREVLDLIVHLPSPTAILAAPAPPAITPPTRVERPPKPKPPVSPEEALDPLKLAGVILKAPLVASIDLKPNWSVDNLLSSFKASSSKFKEFQYVIVTLRVDGDVDVSILLDQDGDIVAWRGVIAGREFNISKPEDLLAHLKNYTTKELKARIWGCKAS